jgi:DNA repair protein RecO (recombination protein O)
MLINDQAVCIRAIDYSENSQVVTFFARQTGKITAMAKGSKRQHSAFGGPVEQFSCGNIVFSDSGRDKMATLVEFDPQTGLVDSSILSADIFVLNCCLFAGELVNVLTKDYDPHPGLFDSLLQLLRNVSRQQVPKAEHDKVLARLILFQLNLLREIGLYPVFESCANCKNPFSTQWQEVYFSSAAGGLICRDCQGAFPDKTGLDRECAKILANIKLLDTAQERIVRQAEDVLVGYITGVLGRPPKMAKYVLNL